MLKLDQGGEARQNRVMETEIKRGEGGVGLGAVVVRESLGELLATMHVDSDLDISKDPFFDQMMLVPFSDTPLIIDNGGGSASASGSGSGSEGSGEEGDFVSLLPLIHQYLGPHPDDTVASTLHALKTTHAEAPLAQHLASMIEQHVAYHGSSACLDKWFQLTRLAGQQGATVEGVCRMDLAANAILLEELGK